MSDKEKEWAAKALLGLAQGYYGTKQSQYEKGEAEAKRLQDQIDKKTQLEEEFARQKEAVKWEYDQGYKRKPLTPQEELANKVEETRTFHNLEKEFEPTLWEEITGGAKRGIGKTVESIFAPKTTAEIYAEKGGKSDATKLAIQDMKNANAIQVKKLDGQIKFLTESIKQATNPIEQQKLNLEIEKVVNQRIGNAIEEAWLTDSKVPTIDEVRASIPVNVPEATVQKAYNNAMESMSVYKPQPTIAQPQIEVTPPELQTELNVSGSKTPTTQDKGIMSTIPKYKKLDQMNNKEVHDLIYDLNTFNLISPSMDKNDLMQLQQAISNKLKTVSKSYDKGVLLQRLNSLNNLLQSK